MALKTWANTSENLYGDDLNSNFDIIYNMSLLNHIRQLIDRTGVYSADTNDLWGEAYVDATGRNNSVDTGYTDATFSTNKYTTTASADSFIYHNIPSGTFSSTISSSIVKGLFADWEDGANIQYKLQSYLSSYVTTEITNYSFESTIGSTWTEISGTGGTGVRSTDDAQDGTYSYKVSETNNSTNDTIWRITQTVDSSDWVNLSFYLKKINTKDTLNLIVKLNGNTLYDSSTAYASFTEIILPISSTERNSSCLLEFVFQGAGYTIGGRTSTTYIDYIRADLRALTDDTGWLDEGEINSFTAFTAEPDTLIVKLIPKTTSPTLGYPSIKGIGVIAK